MTVITELSWSQPPRPGLVWNDRVWWIMTREEEDSAKESAELRRRNIPVQLVPCIECVDRPWPRWQNAAGTPLTFLTSKRAARRYLAQGERLGLVAAVAPSTSEHLEANGVSADIVARGGSVPLAEAVLATWEARGKPAWHVRYPTSDVALETKEQTLALAILGRLGPVQREVVYATQAPEGLRGALAEPLSAPWSVSFYSPSAVLAFLAEAPPSAREPTHVVCFGRSTQTTWNQKRREGWPSALLSSSVVETIVALEESPP